MQGQGIRPRLLAENLEHVKNVTYESDHVKNVLKWIWRKDYEFLNLIFLFRECYFFLQKVVDGIIDK